MHASKFITVLGTLCVATIALWAQADDHGEALKAAIESRSDTERARDDARHPFETLQFFQLEPGMTVAEVLPGGGWYTRILANYLGGDSTLYGVSYADRMWPLFSFATPEFIERRKKATSNFDNTVKGFTDNGIKASGFTFSTVPPETSGSVDRVLMIRALHNLNRFETTAGTRTQAMAAVRAMLKADGMVGVVQHRAPEGADDDWADGSNGYLKQSAVIAMFEGAGFELVSAAEINANPKDKPGTGDMVWRLPPNYRGSDDDPQKRAAMEAIGESDRMTLLFRKAE